MDGYGIDAENMIYMLFHATYAFVSRRWDHLVVYQATTIELFSRSINPINMKLLFLQQCHLKR